MKSIKESVWPFAAALVLAMSGCGGGGGNAGTCLGSDAVCHPQSSQPTRQISLTDVIGPPDDYANKCNVDDEKYWVRAHLNDVYLWNRDIQDVPMSAYSTPSSYYYALLVRSKDRFSFTASQAEIDSYFQSGEEVGYGMNLVNDGGAVRVSYTIPGTPAAQQNIARGAEITSINGTEIAQMSDAAFSNALYPAAAGISNRFTVLDTGSPATRTVTLTAATITRQPVLDSRILTTADNKKIGYVAFTDHIATAEIPLILAMLSFKNAGIDDLVLDVRYNGGGYLYIASDVGTMIGGAAVVGKVFEKLRFNDKHPEKTNDPGSTEPFPFFSSNGLTLPHLNMTRVFVLTTDDTCSASESIINGLSPFISVIRIGGKTCGKPYGMRQANNCGKAYFAIEFEGVNSLGQADYVNGFAPTCAVADDLDHPLGDANERMLKTAIDYRASNSCPATSFAQLRGGGSLPQSPPTVVRPPWQSSRLQRPSQR